MTNSSPTLSSLPSKTTLTLSTKSTQAGKHLPVPGRPRPASSDIHLSTSRSQKHGNLKLNEENGLWNHGVRRGLGIWPRFGRNAGPEHDDGSQQQSTK